MGRTWKASLEGYLAPSRTPSEERRKRLYFALCLGVVIPVVSVFSILDLVATRTIEGLSSLLVCTLLTVSVLNLPRVRDAQPVFRLAATAVLALLLLEVAIGAGFGSSPMWFFLFPSAAFFIFGTREGAIWVGTSVALNTALLLGGQGLGSHVYAPETARRFLITYAALSFFSYGLEASRTRFHGELLAEKEALQAASQQIKTLSGLLPICASCKRIRDDQGYWNQLETFISSHSEAQFSHGLCPECYSTLYPDMPSST